MVWDWNGTLLDDADLVVEALNATLEQYGAPPMTAARYRELFVRPVRRFYERLLGLEIDDAEWARLDRTFHDAYLAALDTVGLASDARSALAEVEEAGCTQSLLSMFPHDHLVPLVEELELGDHFVRIDGLRGGGGGNKAPYLERHLVVVADEVHAPMQEVLVIGDALDDADAARHVGASCVLYEGGSHGRAELEAAGVPVASDLHEALRLGGVS